MADLSNDTKKKTEIKPLYELLSDLVYIILSSSKNGTHRKIHLQCQQNIQSIFSKFLCAMCAYS